MICYTIGVSSLIKVQGVSIKIAQQFHCQNLQLWILSMFSFLATHICATKRLFALQNSVLTCSIVNWMFSIVNEGTFEFDAL